MNATATKELFFIPYSIEDLSLLDPTSIPRHVAIIMDGNRRWAKREEIPLYLGHFEGADTLTKIVRAASSLGIKVLTVFAFSTENWARPPEEIASLMDLFHLYLVRQKESMIKEGVRLGAIGNIEGLPLHVKEVLQETIEATKEGSSIQLVLALNYGGRDEITRATISLVEDIEKGLIKKDEITEKTISSYLDTAHLPDPDFFIRTSGEQRVSNFLLWQICYAEVYVTDVLWPEFNEKQLLKAVLEYQRRERRRGG